MATALCLMVTAVCLIATAVCLIATAVYSKAGATDRVAIAVNLVGTEAVIVNNITAATVSSICRAVYVTALVGSSS